ncbi:hypothetical protein H2198_010243 [Neophaeococcomyces mojaviensis]|uniref:Uncharacterized protein n=1 Tax=Neophaeococcomyces mojaviensis TaxID=3383035 RepID=A0ACC2ZSB9_9EURO|nr:hypothetical protein H2198_010243 [Knufia sp. JES_112]
MSVSSDKSSTINGDRSASTDIEPDDKQKAMGVTGPELAAGGGDSEKKHRSDGKVELTEDDAEEKLGYAYPEWKKWLILVSMNSSASMYGNALDGIVEKYGVSAPKARLGQALFLIAYAFGCEFWAPWSEELGRWPTQQLSLFLVNIWQVLSALSPNFGGLLTARILGGLSTAGGSVTLGVIADLYHPEDTGFQYAVAFCVLSSVGGAPIGTVIGGFVATYHKDPAWIFWVLLIMGGVVQIAHALLVPETRATIILDREAKKRRKNGENAWGPNELKEKRFSGREIGLIWWRPFQMFLTEPIVLWLSLLSGFSDSLIFTFMEAFQPIFKQWNFNTWQLGLAFLSSIIGYILSYLSYLPVIWHHNQTRKKDPDQLSPETRLWWLLFLAPGLVIGLFGFAFTSFGPPTTPWIAPLIFTAIVGITNYAVYKSSIDYMIAAYGPYAASATGGNDLARDFLAGVAALYAHPFYENVGNKKWHLIYPSVILACLAVPIIVPIYVFYWQGPKLRMRSKFAQELEKARQARIKSKGRRSTVGEKGGEKHVENV